MLQHRRAAIAIALVAAMAAPSAFAAPVTVPQTSIRYVDLDLAKPADAQIMLKRIRHAAVAVCRASQPDMSTDINSIERFDTCYRQSVVRAAGALNAPLVTAAASGRGFATQPAVLAQNVVRASDK
ncbi:MAG: UrcA family protein [Alphaproteobacteria bacterium]|nr:UrcA family protein [Alphaproteobacteria bacterium]MBU1512763.1 UrcA family protein [Alphaproteobacteria bacterium]MBU2307968.1 UrcA family protein [Alphaproteobacteria bacterium]MBU2364537.1 UrcA family protein [Alphaproteobacteria bacterium]